jgi:molybdopterin-binding protein
MPTALPRRPRPGTSTSPSEPAAPVPDFLDRRPARATRGAWRRTPVIRYDTPRNTMSILAINVRNQFRGKVREIIEGPVVSEVDVETPSGLIVTSVITTRSVHELGLRVGKDVVALVKSTEVSIATL